jgi:hypothetical protein
LHQGVDWIWEDKLSTDTRLELCTIMHCNIVADGSENVQYPIYNHDYHYIST